MRGGGFRRRTKPKTGGWNGEAEATRRKNSSNRKQERPNYGKLALDILEPLEDRSFSSSGGNFTERIF